MAVAVTGQNSGMLKNDPLVSILIPAYNAQEWIAESIQSAIAQTWRRKEIVVVDDGSRDQTAEIARSFAAQNVKVVSTDNRGLSAAVNTAYRLCQGDYIQELDSDDLLSPNKIEAQLRALREGDSNRTLLSSPWGYFYYRTSRARFRPNSLWHDLSPVEWLLHKLGENDHMQNATWLISRELAEAAGPWNEALRYDQDGEYFTRVIAGSDGVRFVPEGRVYYRTGSTGRLSFIGGSEEKRNSLLISMKAHVRCIRSLEDSARVRSACIHYLQNWSEHFYPDRTDILNELQSMAAELGGRLEPPPLRWKYAWLSPAIGRAPALRAQLLFPEMKSRVLSAWDKFWHRLESRGARG
jgi:glycosyltransferase involved in cell wall biosynthesis